MGNETLTYQDLLQIVELIKSSAQFGSFHLKVGDIEVDIKRGGSGSFEGTPQQSINDEAARIRANPAPPTIPLEAKGRGGGHPITQQRPGHVGGGEIVVDPADQMSNAVAAPSRRAALAYPEGAILVKSPMVGSFYRSPEPGARPFVELGQTVEENTLVCIIEVMKLMNSITARGNGVITHILVEDGEPVEYGQILMVIDPQ